MLISIFTPCYNRSSYLPRLYESLLNQTEKDFEWVIVDDGSMDNTDEVIQSFIVENKISIIYERQRNSGKHIAINKGMDIASGELFFIVDSDDYLTFNALSFIKEKYHLIHNDETVAGISARKGYTENEVIGSIKNYSDLKCNPLDFRYLHKVSGDMAEVVKMSIIRQFKFPIIEGEKFCTEGLMWSRIAQKYNFIWYSDIIYIAEYLEGGLSANSFVTRRNSPKYATLFYAEHSTMAIPFLQKIRANINYWRFANYLDETFGTKWKRVNSLHSLLGYPLSFIFKFIDR